MLVAQKPKIGIFILKIQLFRQHIKTKRNDKWIFVMRYFLLICYKSRSFRVFVSGKKK